jgi:hypothetical protein
MMEREDLPRLVRQTLAMLAVVCMWKPIMRGLLALILWLEEVL